ncbi:PRC-barrel domain-containing protein [Antarcticirhabdus aurantiaca]|uniref:PRC-barrel domain-containing protein n=1 Tax=Antarcticirhabdus aurantiaca TaxID=2606717 RepID=A0ACD4NVN0_9HYPH|nr:PRC-barrel domain-containing protein [Antarcticirhabdus aurantiaca]WAJ30687.1 PRC-barrel domain-containing protein [Jeongeuplla avenae]
MLNRTAALVFASATLLSGAAFAQAPAAAPALVEIADTVTVPSLGMTVDQIDDMNVYSADGTEIGEVGEVYGTTADAATHIEIDFDDDNGSTYPDRDDVLVPVENVSNAAGRLVINLTPEQVQALPTR